MHVFDSDSDDILDQGSQRFGQSNPVRVCRSYKNEALFLQFSFLHPRLSQAVHKSVDIRCANKPECRDTIRTLAGGTQDKRDFGTVHNDYPVALRSVGGNHAIEAALSGGETPVANDIVYA